MSNRQAAPADKSLDAWVRSVNDQLTKLNQRQAGSPNGLIVPGGGAGTWIDVPGASYGANWASFGGPSVRHPQYTIDADGFVHLRGHIQNTVGWSGVMLNMPAGYGVSANESIGCVCVNATSTGLAILSISAATISFVQASIAWSASNWISLSGVTYYVGGQ